jgi:hypothetical protein
MTNTELDRYTRELRSIELAESGEYPKIMIGEVEV